MPRPKKPKEHSLSWGEDPSFKLTEDDKECLLSIVGMREGTDKANEMLSCVEILLSQYPSMKEALDNKPRPAAILEEIKPVKKTAEKLLKQIDNLTSSSKTIFSVGGTRSILETEDAIKQMIATLNNGIKETNESLKEKESRHAHRKEAARKIAGELYRIFDFYNTSDINDADEFVINALAIIEVELSMRILTEVRQTANKRGAFIPDIHKAGKVIHGVTYFNLAQGGNSTNLIQIEVKKIHKSNKQ